MVEEEVACENGRAVLGKRCRRTVTVGESVDSRSFLNILHLYYFYSMRMEAANPSGTIRD
jgi:hypothetical protein